jgi:hypothetical protein
MLIPSKFSGYQSDGCRLLHVGGGVGEAALLGAAMGGGSAALTGGDPLKGALLGGLTGGIGGGISTLTPAATTAGTALPAAPAAAAGTTTAAIPAATTTAAALPSTAGGAGITTLSGAAPTGAVAAGGAEATAADVINQAYLASGSPPTTGGTFTEGMARFVNDPIASIKRNPFPAGASALSGAVGARKEMEKPGGYDGPLKRFRYNPDVYRPQFAEGGIASLAGDYSESMASGGISALGSYSDGGRMLKGPGDGMSDSIPASIGRKRPARLADGEFVVPADVVSHLGNGSTDAGARQLYAMMDKVRDARTGTKKQGRQIRPQKMMPA